ncbi:YraN family protein [Geobacter sp. DSM 9736]|uniref:YraN family protein n=1 Tax=Geobacter sp. DSM 9736 TaxID=1277350 RepID=UPI000B50FC8E|nr:YraN family protein [Geobacter sp. DSM 9736]SNB46361.1 putative endonuclease [Geobacter sp. DSM 9736]
MTEASRSLALGARGEQLAAAYLKGKKFVILERNYRCKGGEVDIIARDGRTVVFVEVKTRRNHAFGLPQEAVTLFKQRQISKAALVWLSQHRQLEAPARFDVVAVVLGDNEVPDIDHIKNAFDLAF